MVDLSIIIVSWNCKPFLDGCLHSFREHLGMPAEVIVVDNNSSDGTAEMVKERYPEVKFVRSSENLGFARANNLGILVSTGRYLALINPDVKLLPGCIEGTLAALDSDHGIGVVGPQMLDADGSVQRSGMRFPGLWNSITDAFVLHRFFGRRAYFGGHSMTDFAWDERREVDVLNGWFWVIRREAIDDVGLLDERFFMYGEDLDWCKRFWAAQWKVVFEPRASAIHYGGGSSTQAPIRFYLELHRANLQYWQKHRGAIASSAYALVLAIHHFARAAAYGAVHLLGNTRDAEAEFKMRRSVATLKWLLEMVTHKVANTFGARRVLE